MGLKITAPKPVDGVREGITFIGGVAEAEDIDVAAFMALAAAGYRIDGAGGPTAADLAAHAAETEN
ncbi:hypothetical protein MRBLWO14_000983 [Microbacterium sp. LWO14-1.2]|uniref:hypothetical protein n=1 Tax=Microbacterium sp. LWO14-1.2 TaxID=3135263 RepID=UPI00313876A9